MKALAAIIILTVFTPCQALTPDDEQGLNEDAVETAYLATAGRVSRTGDLLSIKTSSGVVTFENSLDPSRGYLKSTLAGYFRINNERTDYAIRQDGAVRRFILVNGETGKQISLKALPVLSPDRARYLAADSYSELTFTSGGLSIIRTTDFSEEARINLGTGESGRISGPTDALWISPTRISFTKRALDEAGRSIEPVMMTLAFINKKWEGPRGLK